LKKPLTQQGIYQAKAANGILDKFPFWRYYTSDLKRCQKTAKLILGLEEEESEYDGESDDLKVIHTPSYQVNNNNNNDENNHNHNQNNNVLILDERLRERAKGVREGRDKTLTYNEAFELYCLERAANNENDESMWKLPLLELENEVWERVQDWIEEIVQDAYKKSTYLHVVNEAYITLATITSASNPSNNALAALPYFNSTETEKLICGSCFSLSATGIERRTSCAPVLIVRLSSYVIQPSSDTSQWLNERLFVSPKLL
jgi:broad specificity phosphatase PhoE